MNDRSHGERVQRGAEARRVVEEFLTPAFAAVEAEYTAKLSAIAAEQPWETGKIAKLAMANKVLREVESQLRTLVLDGEVAQRDLNRARRIADLPEGKRRLLDILPHR